MSVPGMHSTKCHTIQLSNTLLYTFNNSYRIIISEPRAGIEFRGTKWSILRAYVILRSTLQQVRIVLSWLVFDSHTPAIKIIIFVSAAGWAWIALKMTINGAQQNGNDAAARYRYPQRYLGQARPIRIAMIGAGVTGIAAVKLFKEAFPDEDVEFIIYEKNHDITGTWLENRYPGWVHLFRAFVVLACMMLELISCLDVPAMCLPTRTRILGEAILDGVVPTWEPKSSTTTSNFERLNTGWTNIYG